LKRSKQEKLTAPIPELAPVINTVFPSKRDALNKDMLPSHVHHFFHGRWMAQTPLVASGTWNGRQLRRFARGMQIQTRLSSGLIGTFSPISFFDQVLDMVCSPGKSWLL
jgi:hypothetical protein